MVHADRWRRGAGMSGAGADEMPTTLKTAAESYLRAKALSRRDAQRVPLDPQEMGAVGQRNPRRATAEQGHPRVP